jgi:hypothetical protein
MQEFLYDVPDVLYKYRDWGNDKHKQLLENRELYFSSIDQFNDPFDGTIPYRYNPNELTEENIFLKYYQIIKSEYPDWKDDKIHEHCYSYQQKGHFVDEKYLEDFEEDTLKQINRDYGIVCLCKERDNFLLWSHYSKSHQGFCIGFDKTLLFEDTKAGFAHMQYEEELPTLNLFDNVFESLKKLIGTKSKIWIYENEYRLTRIHYARTKVILSKETIVEIILGCKMEQTEKFKILNLVEQDYPHARVYDMKLSKTKFETEIMQIR